MTLPKNVADAVDYIGGGVGHYSDIAPKFETIRAHLMSQEVEIDRMRCDADDNRDAFGELLSAFHKSESRLAAANALLEIIRTGHDGKKYDYVEARDGHMVLVAPHLQGAGDEGGRPA